MTARPAAGGGRWVEVAPGRLRGWLDGFVRRHGPATGVVESRGDGRDAVSGTADEIMRFTAADGAVAECHVPFPPLTRPSPESPPDTGSGHPFDALADLLVTHAEAERRVAVLLVRLGGHAAGIFHGDRLVVSKVGSRHVHGRSAAGGWSQRRFARRRDKQANEALRAAADVAARVLAPRLAELEALIVGGDRRAVDALRDDRRLTGLFALETGPFLAVPDPGLAVLAATPARFRAVRIRVIDPP